MQRAEKLNVLRPAADFWPDRLALLRRSYPLYYGVGSLSGWFKAALTAAVPTATSDKDPIHIQKRLELYLFAMMEARCARTDRLFTWHGTLETLHDACCALRAEAAPGVWLDYAARVHTTLIDVAAQLGAHDAETQYMGRALVLCYARTFFDTVFAGKTPYAEWTAFLHTLAAVGLLA